MTTEELFLSTPIAACWKVDVKKAVAIPYIKPERVIETVCDLTETSFANMQHKTRKREIVQARQITMVMLYYYSTLSLKAIGESFGNRDHSTVIHAKKTVSDLIDTDTNYKNLISEIQLALNRICGKEVVIPGKRMRKKYEILKPNLPVGIVMHVFKKRSLKDIIRNA